MCENCEETFKKIAQLEEETDPEKREQIISELEESGAVTVVRGSEDVTQVINDRMSESFFRGMKLAVDTLDSVLYDSRLSSDEKVIVLGYLSRKLGETVERASLDLLSSEESRVAMADVRDLSDLINAFNKSKAAEDPIIPRHSDQEAPDRIPDIDIREGEKPRGIRYEDTDDGQIN